MNNLLRVFGSLSQTRKRQLTTSARDINAMNRLAMPQNIGLSIGPMGAEAAAVGFFSGMNGCVSGKVSLIPEGASTQRAAVAAAGAAVTTTVAEGVATQQHLQNRPIPLRLRCSENQFNTRLRITTQLDNLKFYHSWKGCWKTDYSILTITQDSHLGKWLRWASFGTPRCVFPTN